MQKFGMKIGDFEGFSGFTFRKVAKFASFSELK